MGAARGVPRSWTAQLPILAGPFGRVNAILETCQCDPRGLAWDGMAGTGSQTSAGGTPARPIAPRGPLDGRVRVPGSRSIANRALVCAALAPGRSALRGM